MKSSSKTLGHVEFPKFTGTTINMLPFIMGDKKSLPSQYQNYWSLIESCQLPEADLGKVGYLSVTESITARETSQRRSGIHTEASARAVLGSSSKIVCSWGGGWGGGSSAPLQPQKPATPKKPKMLGEDLKILQGGLYMASTIKDSCELWDVELIPTHPMGFVEESNLEVLSNLASYKMDEIELVWVSDKIPHQSLKLPKGTQRQWFRLVTNEIHGWYAKHSTVNELGIKPDCPIILEDKFKLFA